MVGEIRFEVAEGQMPIFRAIANGDRTHADRAAVASVAIAARLTLAFDPLREFIDVVDAARGVHPTSVSVEALVDEELSPGGSAVDVESLVARHLLLGAEEEAGMRVDQKQRFFVA